MKMTPNTLWVETLPTASFQKNTPGNPLAGTARGRNNTASGNSTIVTLSKEALDAKTADQADKTDTPSRASAALANPVSQSNDARKSAARMRVSQIKQQLKAYLDMHIASNPYTAKSLVSTLRRLADELKGAAAILLEGGKNGSVHLPTLSVPSGDGNSAGTPPVTEGGGNGDAGADAQSAADAATTAAEAHAVAAELAAVATEDIPVADTDGVDTTDTVAAATAGENKSASASTTTGAEQEVSEDKGEQTSSQATTDAPGKTESAKSADTSQMRADAELVRDTLSHLKTLAALVRMHLRDKADKDEDNAIRETTEDIEKLLGDHADRIQELESGDLSIAADITVNDAAIAT